MVPLWNTNAIAIKRMIREFTRSRGLAGDVSYETVYQSNTFGAERQVLKLTIGGDDFALKLDTKSHATGRLRDEYLLAEKLFVHFSNRAKTAIPKPIYLSPKGNFFVLEYIGSRTASASIRRDDEKNAVGQIFRRAGMWLHDFHEFTPRAEVKFWPNWIIEAIDAAVLLNPHGEAGDISRLRRKLEAEAARLQGRLDTRAFCHGDFHASNLILGRGTTYGFDFTEAGEKLALYDVVDFLKIDAFRESVKEEVDGSGVSRHCKEMFLKRYRHPFDEEVLDFCIRGRLLIDWVAITKERYAKSAFQRNKFARFKERLDIAFSG